MSTFSQRSTGAGVAVAAGIGVLLAVLGLSFGTDPSSVWAYVLPSSLPVGVALAWHHGRAVGSSRRFPLARVILMALQALVLGALMVAATMAFVAGVSGREQSASVLEAIGQAIGLAALGIVFLGIPMLALILPLVVLWAVLVRRLSRSRDSSAKG